MEPETAADSSVNLGLLRYEINRVKSQLKAHGGSPARWERLNRLEYLLATCPPLRDSGQAV